jgi:signal transduction histidine kinase
MEKDISRHLMETTTEHLASLDNYEGSIKPFMDALPDAYILLDKEFRYVYFNAAAEKFSGIKLEEARGQFSPFRLESRKPYIEVLETGKSLVRDDVYIGEKLGSRRFRVRAFKVGDGLGLIWTDITAEKEIEAKYVQAREELRSLATYLLQVREDERKHVAREIHDELGQALTAIDMELKLMSHKHDGAPSEIRARIDSIIKQSEGAIETVQRIASELRPGMLDQLGLHEAIEWFAHDFTRRSTITTETDIDIDGVTIGEKTSTALFRITQEALTNASRHSSASTIWISLRIVGNAISLEIRDDGVGITDEQATNPKSFGIIGIRERVHELGGAFAIRGEARVGTTLSVSIPISPTQGIP